MCYIITVYLPESAKLDAFPDIAKSHQLDWVAFKNRHVLNQLTGNWSHSFYTHADMCNCGTLLGSARDAEDDHTQRLQYINSMKLKGWSEVKIQKWIKEQERKADKAERMKAEQIRAGAEENHELDNWIGFISKALADKATSKVGVMLNFYTTDIDSQQIDIEKMEHIHISDLNKESLMNLKEGRFYQFDRKQK